VRNKVGGSFSTDALADRLTVGVFDPADMGALTDFERMGFAFGVDLGGAICFGGEE
jgi:hypothetical protein